ncbi:transposase [Ensifer adhaerens]|uniref:Transposase n=1 Tax=Ensifer adhaerens TaxID=106592 RepID=A0ACC5SU08_ENSAD|nr:transposase [Ensifer adhaerens]
MLALSVIYEGGSRGQAASIEGVGRQIIRDWVERFNLHGPDGLKTGKATGLEPLLKDEQRTSLAEAVEKGPVPYLDGVVRWRLADLVQWRWQEHRISVSRQTLGRELTAMGYRKLSARPKHHAQDPQAIEEFKKTSQPQWQKSLPEPPEASE